MAITTNVPYGFELDAMPIDAFGGVGGFKMKPIPGSLQLHGGRARKIIAPVVAIAAAVAIPFAAPAIATSIGLSAAVGSTVASVTTGAVLGAAAGAASSAIGGGNVGQGALIGGLGGAVGGYAGAPGVGQAGYVPTGGATATATGGATTAAPLGTVASVAQAAPVTTTPVTTAPTVAAGGTGISGAGGFTSINQITGQVAGGATSGAPSFVTGAGSTGPGSLGAMLSGVGGSTTAAGGFVPGVAPSVAAGTGVGGTTIPTVAQLAQQAVAGPIATGGAGLAGTAFPSVIAAAPTPPTFGGTPVTGLGPTLGAAQTGQLATAPIAGTSAAAATPSWASQFGTSLATRVTDPNVAADVVLRAAGQLAGSAIAGSGLSDEQQQLVDAQVAELQQLREQNQEAFNQRLEAATALLGEARYFDPEYFGLQRARRQQIAGARAREAGLRGLTGEQRRAEERRYNLASARDVGTAYDQGYLTGVQGSLQTQQAGLSALPVPSQYATTGYGALGTTLSQAEQQRLAQSEQIGNLFGGLFGGASARSTG